MAEKPPFNIARWAEENKDRLKPPISNYSVYKSSKDYIVMIVGGPNNRKDYHYNQTEEIFYQLKGTLIINTQEGGNKEQHKVKAGEMFLLPREIPHNIIREKDSVGIVVERKRENTDFKDGLMWFCENCNNKLHEVYFKLKSIEDDFKPYLEDFYSNDALTTCSFCKSKLKL